MTVLLWVVGFFVWYLAGLLAGLIFANTAGLVWSEFDSEDLAIIGVISLGGSLVWFIFAVWCWVDEGRYT